MIRKRWAWYVVLACLAFSLCASIALLHWPLGRVLLYAVAEMVLGDPTVRAYRSLEPGMSRADVVDRLGRPLRAFPAGPLRRGIPAVNGYPLPDRVAPAGGAWLYVADRSCVVCYVFFDAHDRVTEVLIQDYY